MQAFAFQPVRHESGIFRFEWIKVCLCHDLSSLVESAQRNMKSKLAIKFPLPMSSDQMPRPGEDLLVHQIPSLPGSKRRQMLGVYPVGGGGV